MEANGVESQKQNRRQKNKPDGKLYLVIRFSFCPGALLMTQPHRSNACPLCRRDNFILAGTKVIKQRRWVHTLVRSRINTVGCLTNDLPDTGLPHVKTATHALTDSDLFDRDPQIVYGPLERPADVIGITKKPRPLLRFKVSYLLKDTAVDKGFLCSPGSHNPICRLTPGVVTNFNAQ